MFAGIKSAYQPEHLVGRLVVVVANLAPRKMQFGVSEGMVVAAGPGGAESFCSAPTAAPCRASACIDDGPANCPFAANRVCFAQSFNPVE